jgi:predicted nucleotidyltransferase component of viral defense system
MKVPIAIKLKSREFLDLAELQDLFIDTLLSLDSDFVLHGGTGIWRCYSGNRFSFDIDVYVASEKKIENIKNSVAVGLGRLGIYTDKISATNRSLRIYVSNSKSKLSVDIKCWERGKKGSVRDFERINGTTIKLRTLTAEQYILEKIDAYESRKYARDLYDIYQLLTYIEDKKLVKGQLKEFIANLEEPANEKELQSIVYSGPVPSFGEMRDMIEREVK